MTHSTEVVDFIWLDISDNCDKIGGVTKITVVKKKLYAGLVTVAVDVIDTPSVEG